MARKKVGELIKEARTGAGMTQEQLARKVKGISAQDISKAELRKRAGLAPATFTKLRRDQEVNLSVLIRIAGVLNCNAGDMMDFIPEQEYMPDVGVDEVW